VNFSKFFDATHISKLNCDKMAGDRPRVQDNLYMKFLALNVDFSSQSPDPLDSKRPAQVGVKNSCYPLKMVILPQLSRVS